MDPAIPLLGKYPEQTVRTNSKRHMHPKVYSSTISTGKSWKQSKCPLTQTQCSQIRKLSIIKVLILPLKRSVDSLQFDSKYQQFYF